MEKRVLLALVLCGLVLLLHHHFFSPPSKPQPPAPEPIEKVITGDGAERDKPVEVQPGGETEPASVEVDPSKEPTFRQDGSPVELRTGLVLENEELHTEWTNNATGACTLVRYRKFYVDISEPPLPLDVIGGYPEVLTKQGRRAVKVLDLNLAEPRANLSDVRFAVVEQTPEKIVFEGIINDEQGKLLKVTKTVSLPTDTFQVKMDVEFTNVSDREVKFRYDVGAAEAMHIEDEKRPMVNVRSARWGSHGACAFKTKHFGKFKKTPFWEEPGLDEQTGAPDVLWTGLENKYFAVLLLGRPPQEDDAGQLMRRATARAIMVPIDGAAEPMLSVTVRMESATIDLQPGQSAPKQEFILFAGPKKRDVTERYEQLGFMHLHYSGWFRIVTDGLMWLLHKFHSVVGNYGVAIILLTILIRVCMHPLTKKGQVSMHKMQLLQPKIKELQAKHKGDKTKLGAEQMKLMRAHGANPLSGCLPMLVQMPILIGLWRGLNSAFALRQAPFMLWMKDLSRPDGLVIPGIGPVNVLPLLMAVSMFIQQRMTPKSPDPQAQQQMKMMMFLPFFFAFMFYSFPSGLCLYWFVSTLVGMLDQYFIKRHLKQQENLANVVGK